MARTENIVPLGAPESIRSPMLAEAFALLNSMPTPYIAELLPLLARYSPAGDQRPTAPPGRSLLTIHWPGSGCGR